MSYGIFFIVILFFLLITMLDFRSRLTKADRDSEARVNEYAQTVISSHLACSGGKSESLERLKHMEKQEKNLKILRLFLRGAIGFIMISPVCLWFCLWPDDDSKGNDSSRLFDGSGVIHNRTVSVTPGKKSVDIISRVEVFVPESAEMKESGDSTEKEFDMPDAPDGFQKRFSRQFLDSGWVSDQFIEEGNVQRQVLKRTPLSMTVRFERNNGSGLAVSLKLEGDPTYRIRLIRQNL